ncbi:hypothetical protein [uncultured Porphyromonas sp.]|uniref:LysM peptidoglycan-binding domain-containing protein n=1 Tax=uncultured Porphyromonas sp. TaxID=159274 RepID=UPI00261560E3|nr:hypothetical protein [uncultured Porphyromonas sp.]
MLQAEFWSIRLGELASVQPATSETLWEALCTQLEQRLLSGVALYFPELGLWRLEEHREYIARTSDGKLWLLPPRLSLSLQQERTTTSVSILLLSEALAETTHVPSEIVGKWLRGISQLWSELLQQGAPISWAGLGDFTPLEQDGQLAGYRFLPAPEFLAALNRPFSMFAPVEVSSTASLQDLEVLDVEHLEDLDEVAPIEVLWASESSVDAEPIPTASPAATPAPLVPPVEEPSPEIAEETMTDIVPNAPEEQLPVPAMLPEEEEKPTPVVEDPLGDPFRDEEERPRLLVWIFVSIGIAIASCLFFFLLSLSPEGEAKPQPTTLPAETTVLPAEQAPKIADSTSVQDSLSLQSIDSMATGHSASTVPSSQSSSPEANRAEQVRLRPGDRLSRLALKKYGHKAFWVYIYEENRMRLKDPDNIPVGAVITLPAASKYQIDPTDTNSVNRALLLQRSLHR